MFGWHALDCAQLLRTYLSSETRGCIDAFGTTVFDGMSDWLGSLVCVCVRVCVHFQFVVFSFLDASLFLCLVLSFVRSFSLVICTVTLCVCLAEYFHPLPGPALFLVFQRCNAQAQRQSLATNVFLGGFSGESV